MNRRTSPASAPSCEMIDPLNRPIAGTRPRAAPRRGEPKKVRYPIPRTAARLVKADGAGS